MRDQQHTQQSEKATLSSQSHAMLNLNMKLQNTVMRNHGKALDFELRKYETQQARRQLQVVTPYLPNIFFEDDKPAIEAYLFFDRLACKTQILLNAIEQTHDLQEGSFPETVSENLVSVCEARTRIAIFMVLCKRFTVNLQRCEPATFVRMGKVYVELFTVEKRLDACIELAKKEELKVAATGLEIERYTAQGAHIAESQLGESGLDFGEQQLGQVLGVEFDIDIFLAGVGYTKQTLAVMTKDSGEALTLLLSTVASS